MADAKVTIAVLTRNRSQLLREALRSVLAQAGVDLEVIVFDNASTDDTPDVVRAFGNDPRVSYQLSDTDIGLVRNWNRGLQAASARSPYVGIFHDDDIMLPGFLAESTRALAAHRSAGMSLCIAEYIRADGSPKELQRIGDIKEGLNRGLDFLEMVAEGRGIEIPPPIVLFRSEAIRRAGAVDSPHTRGTLDMNFYFRLAALADVVFVPKVLVQYRLHGGSDTETINRTAGGTFWYGTMAERVDAIAYLLRSERAADADYRRRLVERLLAAHAHQSVAIHPSVPQMYHGWDNTRALLLDQLETTLPPGEPFVLIDDQQVGIGEALSGRGVIPFLEHDGKYWGPPNDAQQAIDNLQRLRDKGIRWLAVAWTSYWWLDQFGHLSVHLDRHATCVLRTPHVTVFKLSN